MKRRSRLAGFAYLAIAFTACSTADPESTNADVKEKGIGNYTTPDPNNAWMKGVDPASLAIGQEVILDGEEEMFAAMAKTVNAMQDALAAKNGGAARGFHAKAHACVLGELHVEVPDDMPEAKVGLFAENATYPTWVRYSNGVGFKQKDKRGDVRGLALKVMKVPGKKLLAGHEDDTTQDFLATNGATTPAPDSQQFVDFGKAIVDAEIAGEDPNLKLPGDISIKLPGIDLGPLRSMFATGGYLLRPENKRVREYLISKALPRVLKKGSMLGEQFWSGGAIALGVEEGAPMTARASQAIKFTMIPGVVDDDGSCQTVKKLPSLFDEDYFKKDLRDRMKGHSTCIDIQIQFQKDAEKQLIEDTSVEWRESDTPFTSIGYVVIPPTDLDSPDAQKKTEFCNHLGYSPWHTLAEHRPLGNIMRARKTVYEASREFREGAAVEPTGDEFPAE